MSRVVNATLGDVCTYIDSDGIEYPNIPIIIDRNSAVKDAIGNLIGFEVVANVEKQYIPFRPSNLDKIIDDECNNFSVGQLREETHSKWYFIVTER